ncbi:MAG: hypothetical protein KDA63_08600 [Planctomycetales bacterium]|nr:hypothetical protein [Planctomycetales bacterium]
MDDSSIPLIHPIYLDVPMLVSFAAATQGGLSLGSEITEEKIETKATDARIDGKLGVSNLFSKLFEASVAAEAGSSTSDEGKQLRRESKSHTEASIAILLYDHLKRNEGFIIAPSSVDDCRRIEAGALVEVTGTLAKNAIDWVIDFIDAVSILGGLDSSQQQPEPQGQRHQRKQRRNTPSPTPDSQLRRMRELMDQDRQRTPISNAVLRCSQPDGLNAVVTLRTANLRDLTLSELNKNTVRVIGKVTRTIGDGESMSAFENYGFALLKPDVLRDMFTQLSNIEEMVADFTDVEVTGPAIQLLPLMVFV